MSKTEVDTFLSNAMFGKSHPTDLGDGGEGNLDPIDFCNYLDDAVADPVGAFVAKVSGTPSPFITRANLTVTFAPALAKTAKAKDGPITEIVGSQRWTHHYVDDQLVASELQDEDLAEPMFFDGSGKEVSSHEDFESLLKQPGAAKAAVVDPALEKLLGLGAELDRLGGE